MKIDATVRRETIYIAVWVGILSLLMEAVFLIIGKWDYTVLLGNLLSGAVVQLCLRGQRGGFGGDGRAHSVYDRNTRRRMPVPNRRRSGAGRTCRRRPVGGCRHRNYGADGPF